MTWIQCLSDKMLTETPCNRTISRIYLPANCTIDYATLNGGKCIEFVRWSMITQTALLPFRLWGSVVTKSIVTYSHFHSSIGNSWRSLADLWRCAFTCWHTGQFATYCVMSFFIAFHQKYCFRSWYILVPPRCIEYAEPWASAKIFCQTSPWGTLILLPK